MSESVVQIGVSVFWGPSDTNVSGGIVQVTSGDGKRHNPVPFDRIESFLINFVENVSRIPEDERHLQIMNTFYDTMSRLYGVDDIFVALHANIISVET